MSEEQVRDLLEHRLESLRDDEQRIGQMIDMLDHGATVADIRAEFGDEMLQSFFDRRREFGEFVRERRDRMREDRPGFPRGDDDQGPPRLLSEEERRRVIEFVKEASPRFHERLMRLREQRDEEAFRRTVERIAPEVGRLMREREQDPELFELKQRLHEREMALRGLLREHVESGQSDLEPLLPQLREIVAQQFELQLQIRRHEVERINARLDEIQREIAEHSDRRSELIEQRIEEIIFHYKERGEKGRDWVRDRRRDSPPRDRDRDADGSREEPSD